MDSSTALAETFVELADDFDLIDFLDRLCTRAVELFSVDASGLMLRNRRGALQVLAASAQESRLVELFQIQNAEGPCLEAIRTGRQVRAETAPEIERRWPKFGERVHGQFASVYALPMRLRADVIGGLNLFGREPAALGSADLRVARALADTATIGIIQQRAVREATLLSEQLQSALNTRVGIEQAKGIYAERHAVDMGEAWEALRAYSRNNNVKLHDVASRYINGELDIGPVQ